MSIKEIRDEVISSAPTTKNVLGKRFIVNLPAGTTPSVLNNEIFLAKAGAPVNVTDFHNAQDGQEILVRGDGQTTVVHGSGINTLTGSDTLLVDEVFYRFVYVNQDKIWYQV